MMVQFSTGCFWGEQSLTVFLEDVIMIREDKQKGLVWARRGGGFPRCWGVHHPRGLIGHGSLLILEFAYPCVSPQIKGGNSLFITWQPGPGSLKGIMNERTQEREVKVLGNALHLLSQDPLPNARLSLFRHHPAKEESPKEKPQFLRKRCTGD
uniref:transmembrane protein 273 isoform X5 n=1 Tax=Macaca mulatta TaxID=9544 RepID=UPI0010A2756B|nr:transmembrane protein 273 isoform X5 [Macaca mulatta]